MGSREMMSTHSLIEEGLMNRKGYGWIVIIDVLSAGLGQSAIAENIQTTKAEHPKLKGLLEEAVQ
jgi:LDH2 family malate/lactate/ureidoglycolate dehydrogenase